MRVDLKSSHHKKNIFWPLVTGDKYFLWWSFYNVYKCEITIWYIWNQYTVNCQFYLNNTKFKIHTPKCICIKHVRMTDCGRRRMKTGIRIKEKKNNREEGPCPDQWWIILWTLWEIILRSIINLTFYIWRPTQTKRKGSLTTPRRPSVLHTSIWPSYLFSGNCIIATLGSSGCILFSS